jgi:hypothetical protein
MSTVRQGLARWAEVDPRIEARMMRQRRLDGEEPLRLSAVVNEGALRQQVGGPDVPPTPRRRLRVPRSTGGR